MEHATTEIVREAVTEALKTARPDGWEAQMMVAFVAVVILVIVAALIAFYRLSQRYMIAADSREAGLTARLQKMEDELSQSGSRRAADLMKALSESAESNRRAASMIEEVGQIVRQLSHERSVAMTVLDWFGKKKCLALDAGSVQAFQSLLDQQPAG